MNFANLKNSINLKNLKNFKSLSYSLFMSVLS